MGLLNRCAVIIKPRTPYLEWAKQDDAEGLAEGVFESMRSAPQIYLVPSWDDDAGREAVLEDGWSILFELMLECWVTDETYWPEPRTREMFDEWFEHTVSESVEDLVPDEPIKDLG